MVKLSRVFGITSSIPEYTYINRSRLDERFKYLLDTEKHIVIHGTSKQGKTVLRKKNLPEEKCIIVRCRYDFKLESLYEDILRQLNVTPPKEITKSLSIGGEGKLKAQGEVNIPFVTSASGEVEGKVKTDNTSTATSQTVGLNSSSLGYVSSEIKKSRKRVVVEDFHYLPDEEQTRLAFDLKALWDESVFFIIIGVWAEQNLLTYYNGDLSGRISEIDIKWSNEELAEVIKKGEEKLNTTISTNVKNKILQDANQNVGLLQRIAEQYCLEEGVTETEKNPKRLSNTTALERCRTAICEEESVRYRQFTESIMHGLKKPNSGESDNKLKVYQRIAQVCLDASDEELCNGLHYNTLLARTQELENRIRTSDLTAALNRLGKLQANRKISPLILSYNENLRTVYLVDRELLFYRKYGNPQWAWESS